MAKEAKTSHAGKDVCLEQLSIFDFSPQLTPEEQAKKYFREHYKPRRKGLVHKEDFKICEDGKRPLSKWAFLLTSGMAGFIGYHFMMPLEDAVKWCESDASRGSLYGNPWSYFFVNVDNYAFHIWDGNAERDAKDPQTAVLDLRGMKDNGKYDKKISEMGLRKYNKKQIKEIMGEYGIKILI